MPFEIEFAKSAFDDLNTIRVFDRRKIMDAIDEQLEFQPNVETKNRKCLIGAVPDFEHVPPIWELRVGDYRIFYDIDEDHRVVTVRAIKEKPPHAQTEDIL